MSLQGWSIKELNMRKRHPNEENRVPIAISQGTQKETAETHPAQELVAVTSKANTLNLKVRGQNYKVL